MSPRFFRHASDPMFVPEMGPDTVSPPNPALYGMMGEAAIHAMLQAFYEELGRSEIAGMFPGDRVAAAERSALFFIGLLGGPPLYAQRFGAPRMRARHLPFRITTAYRDVWLASFERVLKRHEEFGMPASEVPGFRRFLEGFSAWMVNSSEDA